MKRKPQELTKDSLVKYISTSPYGGDGVYTIRAVVRHSEKAQHRMYELRGRAGKVRFAKGLELRLANRKERQEFSSPI